MIMLTVSEAMNRMRVNNARMTRDVMSGDWIVSLCEWRDGYNNPAAYYTNDLEDAVLTAGFMRRNVNRRGLA
jgi:hypothetical protein